MRRGGLGGAGVRSVGACIDRWRMLRECLHEFRRVVVLLTLEDEKLRRVVEQYAPGAALDSVERLTGGVSAEVYRVGLSHPDGGKEQVVLRIHGATHSGHSAELEFQILTALYQAGVLVPEPLSLDASCAHLDNPYLIIGFVEGSSAVPGLMLRTRIETMVEALISVHEVPAALMPTSAALVPVLPASQPTVC